MSVSRAILLAFASILLFSLLCSSVIANEMSAELTAEPAGKLYSGLSSLQIAQSSYDEKNYEKAIALLEESTKKEASGPTLKSMLGLLSDCYVAVGRFDQSEETLERVISLYPEEEGAWRSHMADDFVAHRKYPEAIVCLRKAAARLYNGGQLGVAFGNLAQCYAAMQRKDEEAVSLGLAPAARCEDEEAAALRLAPVVSLETKGRYAEALALSRKLLTSEKSQLLRRALLFINAECTHALGDWEGKHQVWESLASVCPEEELVWRYSWAMDLQTQGKIAESFRLLNHLLQLKGPEWIRRLIQQSLDKFSALQLAQVDCEEKNYEKAIVRLEDSIGREAVGSTLKNMLSLLSDCHVATGQYEKSKDALERLISLFPEEEGTWRSHMATDLMAHGKHSEAIPHLKKAAGSLYNGGQLGAAYSNLAKCYAAIGSEDEETAALRLAPVVDLEASGRWAEALALSRELLVSEKDQMLRRALLFINAECTHMLGDWEGKHQVWESLADVCPEEELVWRYSWAMDLWTQGKAIESVKLLNQLSQHDGPEPTRRAVLRSLDSCYTALLASYRRSRAAQSSAMVSEIDMTRAAESLGESRPGLASLQLAQVDYKDKNYEKAISRLNESIKKEVVGSTLKSMLSLLSDCHVATGQYEKSKDALERLISLFPEEEGAWQSHMAKDVMDHGDYSEAIPHLKKAAGSLYNGGQLGAAYSNLAKCYAAIGSEDEETAALRLAPVVDLEASGRWAEALALSRELLVSEKDQMLRRALLFINAECTHSLGDWEGKHQVWESLADVCPEEELVWRYSWAMDLQTQGRMVESMELLNQLSRQERPKLVRKAVLASLDECYAALQAWDKKTEVLESLIALEPGSGLWPYEMAQSLRIRNQSAAAIPCYKQSLKKMSEPGNRFWAWYWLANAYVHVDPYRGLDSCLAELDEKQESADWFGRVVIGASDALIDEGLDVHRGIVLLDRVAARLAKNEGDKAASRTLAGELLSRYAKMGLWDKNTKLAVCLIEHYPEDEGIWSNQMADDLRLQARYRESIPFYEKSLLKLPTAEQRYWAWYWMANAYAHVDPHNGLDSCLAELESKQESSDWFARVLIGASDVLTSVGMDTQKGIELLDQLAARLARNEWDKTLSGTLVSELLSRYTKLGLWDKKAQLVATLTERYPEDGGVWNYQMADDLRLRARYQESIPFYEKSLLKLPTAEQRFWAWHWLALAHVHANNDRGLDELFTTLKEKQEDPAWSYRVVLAVAQTYVRDRIDVNKGLRVFSNFVGDLPDTSPYFLDANIALAGLYLETGDRQNGDRVCAALEERYPQERSRWSGPLAQNLVGRAYELQDCQRYSESLICFEELLAHCSFEERPSVVESAHVCVAECIQSLGQTDDAIQYARRLYNDQPKLRGGALFAEAMVCFMAKRYDDSARCLRRLLAEYPYDMHAGTFQTYLTVALQEAGHYDDVMKMLEVKLAAQGDPVQRASIMLQMAVIQSQAKRYTAAIAFLNRVAANRSAPSEVRSEALYRCGCCYDSIGDKRLATVCLLEVAKRYSGSPWALEARRILSARGKGVANAQVKQ